MKRPARALLFLLLAGCSCGAPHPKVVGDCASRTDPVPTEVWDHRTNGSPIVWNHNPPASGPHYFFWARYQRHSAEVPVGYWLHNVEHGAVVLLYRPEVPSEQIAALASVYDALPNDPNCGHRLALMTADSTLPTPIAAVAANFVLSSQCVDADALDAFVAAHRGHGPEVACADGSYP